MRAFSESVVEEAALAWATGLGFDYQPGPAIAPGGLYAERREFGQVVLEERLKQALMRLNPDLPAEACREAFRKLLLAEGANLVGRNRVVHRMQVAGVNVEHARKDGSIAGAQARVIDFESPENNDWLIVNQFTVVEGSHNRRPDVVLFVNGLPLVVLELKNADDEKADAWKAFRQLQTYKKQVQPRFVDNVDPQTKEVLRHQQALW